MEYDIYYYNPCNGQYDHYYENGDQGLIYGITALIDQGYTVISVNVVDMEKIRKYIR